MAHATSCPPERIGSKNSNLPNATFSGVDGLSEGDCTWRGSGANGEGACAPPAATSVAVRTKVERPNLSAVPGDGRGTEILDPKTDSGR